MKVVAADKPETNQMLAKIAAKQLGLADGFGACHTVAVMDDDEKSIAAVIVYSRYSGRDMEMSIASWHPGWCSRKVLAPIFWYPFQFANCARVTATTRKSAKEVRRFLERLGFKQEGVLRKSYLDSDGVVYGMLRSECKWLKEAKK